jgi:hypothetical protein
MATLLQQPATTTLPQSSPPGANLPWSQQGVLVAQGLYFLLTGLWPIVDIASFQAVTGPKTDLWLVRTVGVLIAVIGSVLLLAARQERPPTEVIALGIGAAAGLTVVDLVIVFTRTVSPIYLLDAVLEGAIVAWWIAALRPMVPHAMQMPRTVTHPPQPM